jgi:acetyl esterase/lipase
MTNTIFHEFWQLWSHWNQLGMSGDALFEEERIAFGQHSNQYMIRIGPEEGVGDKAILFYHGGGWQFGHPEMFRKYAYVLVREGYQVFMPSHRKIPLNNYNDIRQDICLALKIAAEWMHKRGGAPPQIVIGGMSSGGNLAALLALDPANLAAAGLEASQIAGLFLLAAPLDLDAMWSSPSLLAFAGARSGERYRVANPINFLTGGSKPPPMLIIHGENDAMVEVESARSFYERAQALFPDRAEWIELPQGSHLDVASWAYQDNFIRYSILHWLKGL